MANLQNTDDSIVIDVQNVKKKFRSYQDKATSFKERFINPSRGKHEDVMVLKGISFQVKRGEAIGIIGKNGCGKSTTLKLLTKILYPNEGLINMKGRVSSLIELGAGFHPDMTGRENIYTNASIFGITRKEVDQRLNDIIRFSELEDYIDSPVRTYSSGMYMRLAFAVAINVDADILLIDEILAVGDSAFQKKCFEKLKEIKANGTTIVIVSHSMDQLYKICDRLIWLEEGLIKEEGLPRVIGEEYLAAMEGRRLDRIEEEKKIEEQEIIKQLDSSEMNAETEAKAQEKLAAIKLNESLKAVCTFYQAGAHRDGNGEARYIKVTILNDEGIMCNQLLTGKHYTLVLNFEKYQPIPNLRFSVGITREDGVYCYGVYYEIQDKVPDRGEIKLDFDNTLLPGNYLLDLWLESLEAQNYDGIYSLMSIKVSSEKRKEVGIFAMPHAWRTDFNTEAQNE